MTGTGTTGTGIIMVTVLIAITLQVTTGGERISAGITKIAADRDTRTTDVLIRNETPERRSVGNRRRNTHESRREA